ncbi:acyl-CoA dehydrogenase [Leptothoe sp. PORK10 BA2]|uniref:acyl-CoA dehydrogenase n=1 Tax=Leptothoe sp. PORK10 BA2 TaxID=3110254 RepID=UPI003FA3C6DB
MTLLTVGLIVGLLGLLVALAYFKAPLAAWCAYDALILGVCRAPLWLWGIWGVLVLVFVVPKLRQLVITAPIVKAIQRFNLLPSISATERAAIEAGTVWVDGELFSGKPNFKRILAQTYPTLSAAEQAFVDGPVEQVCRMATDWEIHQRKDLPPEVWAYLRHERFFGMMIPLEYGGRGFSNTAYSAVMTKLASRSFTHTATVGVTNSLGPAKLLLHYGTVEQKHRYLPKLAAGEEIPCFALTEPTAGSDAASLQSSGTVFKGDDGELYLRLNWQKRYITLGAIATLIGLAVRLRDPQNLLGKGTDVGITCVLVPSDTPGVQLGRRHDPMGVPFYNSPIAGQNVVLPASQIIGGVEQAGQGWTMLMQSLAAGRGISFPATATGVAKLVSRVTSAYSVVREQFGLSIGKFEGVEEPLARIGGLTYLMDAARLYTCGAVDQGEQPAVVSAIAKYQFTELSRQIINDGMDILGGAGICRGPRNLLANIYTATPIPITVEGANILTRSLIIYGQGAIRCHSYIVDEIAALADNNVAAFDRVFWSHVGLMVRNLTRAKVLGWTQGRLAVSPVTGETARYYQKLAWASATFAALSDLAMISYGGSLKRHEKITGRFADMLSWMYLATATLRRFEAEGRREEDLPLVHWAMSHSFWQIQQALEGLLANLDIPVLGGLMRGTTLPWFRLNPMGVMPTDEQGHAVAQLLQSPDGRQRITEGLHVPMDAEQALGRLERAYDLSMVAMPIVKKIKTALRHGELIITPPMGAVEAALRAGVITGEESDVAIAAQQAQLDAIQVDSFTLEEYQRIGKEYIEKEITEAE